MEAQSSDPKTLAIEIWNDTLGILRKDVSVTPRGQGWLEDVVPEGVFGPTIVLRVSSDATQQALQSELNPALLRALKASTGHDMFPAFRVAPNEPTTEPMEPQSADLRNDNDTMSPSISGMAPATMNPGQAVQTEQRLQESPSSSSFQATNPPQAATSINHNQQADDRSVAISGEQQRNSNHEAAPTQAVQPTFAGLPSQRDPRFEGLSAAQLRQRREMDGMHQAIRQNAADFIQSQPDANTMHERALSGNGPTEEFSRQQPAEAPSAAEPFDVDQQKFLRDPQTHLNKAATFDTFVPGDSNRFARTVALAVAEGSGKDFNPLCIYGGSGLGKTHLLNAIGNYALVKDRNLKVRYVTSEEFTNEFIEALQNPSQSQGQIAAFNRRYRQVDVLLIDDIQFLGGKEATLEQFFHTFNALYQANKRIVIASDVAPKNLKGFEARLISRFESGLTVDVKPPDLETRIAILRMMASMNHTSIPNDVLDLIAERFTENIRELEGALTRVTAVASLSSQPVSRSLAEQTLQDFFSSDVEIKPTDIIGQVAKYFHLTFDDLVGRARTKNVALARQIAMYLAREMTSMSLVDIGEVFGGRDHTTVMHAYTRISDEMQEKQEIYNYVMELTVRLKQHSDE
ncbi:chromosomal replication initiator protein [Bifidobacterium bohemicum]|nr:chromosomal replication initiator protein DnaA [Bifidobacterium bohemicum]SCC19431.1 chromosomal replication initiator protein [Bifidobacterium bohemicum]